MHIVVVFEGTANSTCGARVCAGLERMLGHLALKFVHAYIHLQVVATDAVDHGP